MNNCDAARCVLSAAAATAALCAASACSDRTATGMTGERSGSVLAFLVFGVLPLARELAGSLIMIAVIALPVL